MKKLSAKYRISIKLLNSRITELSQKRDIAVENCRKKRIDPQNDINVIELDDRLKPLIQMKYELIEVTREVSHYYDRWWWRSEKLTCNQRKSRKFIYAGPSRYS